MSQPKVYIDKAYWKDNAEIVAGMAAQQFPQARFAVGPEGLMAHRPDKDVAMPILASVKSTFGEQYGPDAKPPPRQG